MEGDIAQMGKFIGAGLATIGQDLVVSKYRKLTSAGANDFAGTDRSAAIFDPGKVA